VERQDSQGAERGDEESEEGREMTANPQARLEAIKAECHKVIELGEKATAGPWHWDIKGNALSPYGDLESPTRTVLASRHDGNFGSQLRSTPQDRAFIAHSRSFSPASARALLAVIGAMLKPMQSPYCTDKEYLFSDDALRLICDQWEKN
jgi:hypothetical protein